MRHFLLILAIVIISFNPAIAGCEANFIYQETSPLHIQFYNQSQISDEGQIYQHWDFGDGNTSYQEHPSNLYSNPGRYVVRLSIFTEEGCFDYIEKEILVGIPASSPNCYLDIYFATQNATAPNYNNGRAYVYGYSNIPCCYFAYWSNGQTGAEIQNLSPGTYCVTLTNGDNCYGTDCVTIGYNNNCNADFSIDSLSFQQIFGLYRFVNNSHGEEDYFYWDFGDGNYSFARNPLHIYREPGNYEVCLTIQTHYNCSSTICKNISVNQVVPNISNLYGIVKAGATLLPSGMAVLYQRSGEYFKAIAQSEIIDGSYKFENLDRNNQYLAHLIPYFDIDTIYFPKYSPVYQSNNVFWQDASLINLYSDTIFQSFLYPYYEVGINNGKISGFVRYTDTASFEENIFLRNWFRQTDFEEDMAANTVVLLKNSNKNVMNFRLTDGSGYFEFKNLAFGSYYISVEKPGLVSDELFIILNENENHAVNWFSINSNNITSITNYYQNSTLKIYPNPANDYLKIEILEPALNYQIIDLTGKILLEGTISDNLSYIEIEGLQKGLYLLQLKSANFTYSIRFIKE